MPTLTPCAFCNRNDSTRSPEDIFAKWIGKYFGADWQRFNLDTGASRGASKNKPGLVTKKVCARCNHGWMSSLERAVEPIIAPMFDGHTVTLTDADQTLIVRWFIKTMMAYDVNAKRTRDCYFTSGERMALAVSLTVPIDTMIFLARYVGDPGVNLVVREEHYQEIDHAVRKDSHSLPRVRSYVATVAIKQLVLQVFSFRRTPEFDRLFGGFEIPDWRQASVQIWPIVQDMASWPPPLALVGEGLTNFAKRWADIAAFLRA